MFAQQSNPMNLTPHFTLEEMERSQTALSLGISNYATYEARQNLLYLCQQVLEPLRQWWGGPIIVSSGYRSPELNHAVGGVSNSQHLKGEAADIVTARLQSTSSSPLGEAGVGLLFHYIKSYLPFDQLILEHDRRGNQWIHVSLRRPPQRNRHQVFSNMEKK